MDKIFTLALFGEAEKGKFKTAYYCDSLPQLVEWLGNPPPNSRGLFFAVQALLYHRNLIFFRVEEEGFSHQDYFTGLHLLENVGAVPSLSAICLPGVGDLEIIHAALPLCQKHHSILITTESDFFDYLMDTPHSGS